METAALQPPKQTGPGTTYSLDGRHCNSLGGIVGKKITDGVSTELSQITCRVIVAKVGMHVFSRGSWILAYAGMTDICELPMLSVPVLTFVVALGFWSTTSTSTTTRTILKASYASIFFTTLPATSVRRNSRPMCL